MYADHAILFLDRSKNKMIFRPVFAPAAPFHFVIAKPVAEITPVQLAEHHPEIEMRALLPEVQLLLHRQLAITDFALGFLRHNPWTPRWKEDNSKLVRVGGQEKRSFF